jgi:AmmeMemoRadiSam system protein A
MDVSLAHQRLFLDAARAVILQVLNGQTRLNIPPTTDGLLLTPAGCFVSLHDQATHRLRGCVGRIQSPDPLIKTLYSTAAGVLSDPRFRNNPVTLSELPRLTLELSVLSPLTRAARCLDFDPLNHGIYLTHSGRSGTFLPQVGRQTGWTREQLLGRLCAEKLGLHPDAWQEPAATLSTYTAVVIGPVPFHEAPQPAAGVL